MSGGALKVVSGSASRQTPARKALAAAIQAVHDAEAGAATLERAIARAQHMVVEAEEALFSAREALGKAKERQTTGMISAASDGQVYVDDGSVRAARLAEIDASDGLEGAKAALAAVEAKLPERGWNGRGPIERAKDAATDAARGVVQGEINVRRMIEATKPVQAELMRRRGELVTLLNRGLVAEEERLAVIEILKSSLLPAVEGSSTLWPLAEHMVAIRPVIEGWEATLAALEADAGAPVLMV